MMIHILTFLNTYNYGSVLQAYALNRFMNEQVGETKTIYYDLSTFDIKALIARLLFLKPYLTRERKFRKFIHSHISLEDKKFKRYEELENYFCNRVEDFYIVGSDQCWIDLSRKEFFLDFVETKNKYAYALSLGEMDLDNDAWQLIGDKIKKFKKISFRESYSSKEYYEIFGADVPTCIDPVFLLDAKEYKEIMYKSKYYINSPEKKYLLVYLIHANEESKEYVKKIMETRGLECILIGGMKNKLGLKNVRFIRDAGIEDFLALIGGADYIATDSFHMTAFSLILKKQFISFTYKEKSRIKNLLAYMKMEDRIICSEAILSDIDYENQGSVYEICSETIGKSKQYLLELLENKKK